MIQELYLDYIKDQTPNLFVMTKKDQEEIHKFVVVMFVGTLRLFNGLLQSMLGSMACCSRCDDHFVPHHI
jgi:hypothetical protein